MTFEYSSIIDFVNEMKKQLEAENKVNLKTSTKKEAFRAEME